MVIGYAIMRNTAVIYHKTKSDNENIYPKCSDSNPAGLLTPNHSSVINVIVFGYFSTFNGVKWV